MRLYPLRRLLTPDIKKSDPVPDVLGDSVLEGLLAGLDMMPGGSFKISFKWRDEQVQETLRVLVNRLGDPGRPLKECGMALVRSIAQNFKAGGRPVKWKPSARALREAGAKTLIKTARLKNSIHADVHGNKLIVGTDVKYAAIQHLGGKIKARIIVPKKAKALRWIGPGGKVRFAKRVKIPESRIPARPYLVVQGEDWRVFRRIFADHLRCW